MTTDWRETNRANWDERVAIHLKADSYDLTPLRAGRGVLHPIEEAEIGPVEGLRILHLQCHFGRDSLTLAQRGADVVGLDFSGPAVAAAQDLAAELGLTPRARFVQADLYDAPADVDGEFDLVFTTWGTIGWLPDITRWAQVVAHFLKPGGALYFADSHPAAQVFDDETAAGDGWPGRFVPYFTHGALQFDEASDYADAEARLQNTRTVEWMHGLGDVVGALISAGLQLEFLHEHAQVPWRMFGCLVPAPGGMYRWPDKEWLPLAYSLKARKP